MPASRSRSRSPRRISTSSKPNSRELITIKTEKDSENSTNKNTDSSASQSTKPSEKPFRKPLESSASKSSGASNWSSSHKTKERKFSGRCRLFVGNLTNCDEKELRDMFEKYGEVAEVFVNKDKGFGFVRLVSISRNEFMKYLHVNINSGPQYFSIFLGLYNARGSFPKRQIAESFHDMRTKTKFTFNFVLFVHGIFSLNLRQTN